jgi:hypothetical protein
MQSLHHPARDTYNTAQHSTLQPSLSSDKVWLVRIGAVFAAVALLAFCTPLIWAAVSAGLGIAALAGMTVVGVSAIQTVPLALQKLENRMLRLRKVEAQRRPIEQLQNEMIRRGERLKVFRAALVTVGAQIGSIEDMMIERSHKDPGHVLERQQKAVNRLKQFQAVNMKRLVEAQDALEEFRLNVKRKESEWEIAMAIGRANDAMDPNATEHLIDDLLTDTALRSVQDRFNAVFAELDVQMSSAEGPTRALLDEHSLQSMDALGLPSHTTPRRTP